MIKSSDLENREELKPANGRPASRPARGTADEGNETEARQALMERIAKAKVVEPQGTDLHCRDCWNRGRNAAIRVIEGKGEP